MVDTQITTTEVDRRRKRRRGIVALLASLSLFTIGAVLWRSGLQARRTVDSQAPRPVAREYLPVALIKLFVHPAAVFALGSAARATGAALTAFELTVLTLAAALPSASNVSLLAERFHADTGRVARIILASTVLAFFSFSGLATWLGASQG